MATADQILSVADFKAQAFIPAAEASQDTILEAYRDAAIEYLEERTHRHLLDKSLTLEVPLRYIPLSTSPFRVADLRSVNSLTSYPQGTPYYSERWRDSLGSGAAGSYYGDYVVPASAQLVGYAYPDYGLRTYRAEAKALPSQQETQLRVERVGREDLWRVWPDPDDAWADSSPYLPVHIDVEVGIPAGDLPKSFTAAAIVYMRYLWSQMPDFREAATIDRLIGPFRYSIADRDAALTLER